MSDLGSNKTNPFICCGMYAFSIELQNAWQALFDRVYQAENRELLGIPSNLTSNLVFDASPELMHDKQLYIAHTCGFPLMKFYRESHEPVCIPVFDVEGAVAKQYSSRIIVKKDSSIRKLSECKGRTIAINGHDSNSGMNVIRHAVCQLSNGEDYFSSVIVSGGHWQSMIEVVEGRADVAAIDCVTYALLEQHQPDLCEQLRTIQWTAATTGLPFVIPKGSLDQTQKSNITLTLNKALDSLEGHHRDLLRLHCFAAVEFSDYESIIDLEAQAQQKGYETVR